MELRSYIRFVFLGTPFEQGTASTQCLPKDSADLKERVLEYDFFYYIQTDRNGKIRYLTALRFYELVET